MGNMDHQSSSGQSHLDTSGWAFTHRANELGRPTVYVSIFLSLLSTKSLLATYLVIATQKETNTTTNRKEAFAGLLKDKSMVGDNCVQTEYTLGHRQTHTHAYSVYLAGG